MYSSNREDFYRVVDVFRVMQKLGLIREYMIENVYSIGPVGVYDQVNYRILTVK